jgi:sulfite exporter TauE/SafE
MDYGLIILGAFLASAHCIGMCGCFALLAGQEARSVGARFTSQMIYSGGRLFTYAFLGSVAGFTGSALLRSSWGHGLASALALLSGALFVLIGLEILGVFRYLGRWGQRASGWFTLGLAPLIRQASGYGGATGTVLMGVLTGFLPCGLVYAFALKAAAVGTASGGLLTMLAFGAGTIPAMVATGMLGSVFSVKYRQYLYRAAGIILVLLGTLTISRGKPLWADDAAPCSCPHHVQEQAAP